jgi:ribonuclease H2 subunit A
LNQISHNAAIEMIKAAIDDGINLTEVFVDTVGDPERYEEMLTRRFQGSIKFTVRKKADSLFKVVSAGSICAKVARDIDTASWVFPEGVPHDRLWGSGYPSDPKAKAWLDKHLDPVFGFPNVVRFSWKPVGERLKTQGVRAEWYVSLSIPHKTPSVPLASLMYFTHREPEDEDDGTNMKLTDMFMPKAKKGAKRCRYFAKRRMEIATDFM